MLLSDLTPNIKNPRKITDEKLQMLEASLKEFGDLSGFIFNRRLGRLEGGHQRQKVMPPDAEVIIEQKFDEPTTTGTVALGKVLWNGEKYAYREVEWDEPKSLAANVAANKHGGDWDLPALEQIMLTLDENNIDLSLTGFNDEELSDLFDWGDDPVKEIEGEQSFSTEIDEGHDYIVIAFDKKSLFEKVCEFLNIESKSCYLSKNGNENMISTGIGRVVDGAEFVQKVESVLPKLSSSKDS